MSETGIGLGSGVSQQSNLDMDALVELQDLLEDDFSALLEEFIVSSEQGSLELVEHLASENLDQLRRGAHSLKGSALNIGAPSLGSCWTKVEDACVASAAPQEITRLLEQAQQALRDTVAALRDQFL